MKKTFFAGFLLLLVLGLSSWSMHKFYVSIYQVNYAPEKKMLQITSRIFIDDLNNGLEHHFHKNTHIGENNETPEDVGLMKKYFKEHFSIKINQQEKALNYRSKELDGNVVVCYFNIRDIDKVNTLEISNTALLDLNPEQQNIIQVNVGGKKQILLLREDETVGMLKF
jgi:hypothetical protein